jgi:uncharacterized protein
MRWIIVFVFLMVFATGCKSQPGVTFKTAKNSNSLLWEITGKDLRNPSFLFGTFHLLCKDDIHFSKQLREAVETSKEVYMELDLDDPSTMLGGLLYMNMKDGKKLADLYTAEEYRRLQNYFSDSLGVPLSLLQSAKPYMLVALLYPKMMNCSSASGVEEELVTIAKADKKEIKGLETVQFQASLFDSIPYKLQAKELLNNIDSFSFYKNQFQQMVELYKNQQLDSMENMVLKSDFGSDKYDDMLLKDRNLKWVSKLNGIMKKESVFVAVGAGHLTGPYGLISLFKKEGYKVVPLVNK